MTRNQLLAALLTPLIILGAAGILLWAWASHTQQRLLDEE